MILPLLEKFKFAKMANDTKVKIGESGESNMLGFVYQRRKKAPQLTRKTLENMELYEMLKEIMRIVNPNFKYNGITINKNVITPPHIDKNNDGNSIIIGLGDYEGGELCVYDKTNGELYCVDVRKCFVEMNGKDKHFNLPLISGTKYTIIYFNNNILNKIKCYIT